MKKLDYENKKLLKFQKLKEKSAINIQKNIRRCLAKTKLMKLKFE